MGLLTVGKPLSFPESKRFILYVRDHGIIQFLHTWERVKGIQNDELKWGDEIEVGVFVVDHERKTIKISLRGAEIRAALEAKEADVRYESEGCCWHPEFGSWMVESTPSKPYSNYASDLLRVERNMILRRRRILSVLRDDEIAPTVTCFPLLGVGDFYIPLGDPDRPFSESSYVPDCVINPHPRFGALVQNIRLRRGSKVAIKVPLFQDVVTPEFQAEDSAGDATSNITTGESSFSGVRHEPDTNINMDCMAFGMGMCCLQVTFQAIDIDESRYMFDQLTVLAPIMLAMTAATPILKGRLAATDVRWNTISQSVDDRTLAERGCIPEEELAAHEQPDITGQGVKRLYKSRYDSISRFIYHCSEDPTCAEKLAAYNDIPCPVDERVKDQLLQAGIDEILAHHIAHLYSRDPLVIFEDHIVLDDEKSMDHFENIQSTNWQTVRWKPPPPRITPEDPHIGWRAEFRSMEVQLTDFENAAFVVFVVLVTRVVLAFDLCLYIPLSKVDENMQRAHEIDAISTQRFFFRKSLAPTQCSGRDGSLSAAAATLSDDSEVASGGGRSAASSNADTMPPLKPLQKTSSFTLLAASINESETYEEMTLDEILNGTGKEEYYPGLIPLVYAYLEYINCDEETLSKISKYLDFISKRARGELITPATFIRNFVRGHADYKSDSVISPEIAYDLMMICKGIGEGEIPCPELLGDISIDRVRPEDAYGHVLAGRLSPHERSALMQKLVERAYKPIPRGIARGSSAH